MLLLITKPKLFSNLRATMKRKKAYHFITLLPLFVGKTEYNPSLKHNADYRRSLVLRSQNRNTFCDTFSTSYISPRNYTNIQKKNTHTHIHIHHIHFFLFIHTHIYIYIFLFSLHSPAQKGASPFHDSCAPPAHALSSSPCDLTSGILPYVKQIRGTS